MISGLHLSVFVCMCATERETEREFYYKNKFSPWFDYFIIEAVIITVMLLSMCCISIWVHICICVCVCVCVSLCSISVYLCKLHYFMASAGCRTHLCLYTQMHFVFARQTQWPYFGILGFHLANIQFQRVHESLLAFFFAS